jgi:hypothetical protein
LYPEKRFGSVAANILQDNTNMIPAGGLRINGSANNGLSDVFKSGGQDYDRYQNKQERDPLNTRDINGSKKNQYGARMYMPDENTAQPNYISRPEQNMGSQASPYMNHAMPPVQHHNPVYMDQNNENPLLTPQMH